MPEDKPIRLNVKLPLPLNTALKHESIHTQTSLNKLVPVLLREALAARGRREE